MNLQKSYMVKLPTRRGLDFVQYIEAEGVDNAIQKARRTFSARLYDVLQGAGSETQKACNKTKLHGRLTFGFRGGHITKDCTGLSIFEALELASRHPWPSERGGVNAIETPISEMQPGA